MNFVSLLSASRKPNVSHPVYRYKCVMDIIWRHVKCIGKIYDEKMVILLFITFS